MRQSPPLLLALVVSLAGCPELDGDDDSTPVGSGCVTLAGAGVFETIQAAIDAAPSGGIIDVCDGLYEEDLEVTKPLTLAGASREGVVVTGGGDGTIIEVDLYELGAEAGPVTITGMTLAGPADETGTTRGIRITDSPDVTVHDVLIGFESDEALGYDHGQLGVELSQSNVVLSDLEIISIGFNNPNGGTGILAQTNSTLEVRDTIVNGAGSFGIRAVDTELLVSGTTIMATNRPELAGDLDSDGTGIFVEGSTTETVLTDTTVENGVFVATWIDGPSVRAENCRFASFGYGIYLPGDASSASARQVTVANSQFEDIVGQSILAVASVDVSGSTFGPLTGMVGPETGFPRYAGINAIAPEGEVRVTSSIFTGNGDWAIRTGKGGSALDPDVANVELVGNTITNVVSGNGIMVLDTASATVSQNTISGVDHAFFNDIQDDGLPGPSAGAILNGFGLAAFRVPDLTLSGNTVSGSEFGNYVLVDTGFSSTTDTSLGGVWNGFHVETSQGVLADLLVEDHAGTAVYFFESTVAATGMQVRRTTHGPTYMDVDGVEDPDPLTTTFYAGGRALEILSNGAPSFASIEGGTFEENAEGGLLAQYSQIELIGNRFTRAGYTTTLPDGSTLTPAYGIYLYGRDENAAGGHDIRDNVLDGADGFYGMYFYDAPGTEVRDNVFCGGTYAGLSVGDSTDLVIEGNTFGEDPVGTMAHCTGTPTTWSYSLYLSESATDLDEDEVVIDGNTFGPEGVGTGFYYYGHRDIEVRDNTFRPALQQAMSATLAASSDFYWDDDGDGYAEISGDCDDTDAARSPGMVEVDGNSIDDDCNEVADDGTSTLDTDADSVTIADGDCDDTDDAVNPGATEDAYNFVDDDCDGTTDTDGTFNRPNLSLSGNTFEGGALTAQGMAIELGNSSDGTPNTFHDQSAHAISLTSWTGPSPAVVAPSLALGVGTVFDAVTGACVQSSGPGASIVVDGATVTGCGAGGFSMYASGTITGLGDASIVGGTVGVDVQGGDVVVADVLIDDTDGAGINLAYGTVALTNVDVMGTGASAVVVSGGALTGTGGTLENTTGGISLTGGTVDWTAVEVLVPVGVGLNISGGAATFDAVQVTGGTLGAQLSGGALTLNGGSLSGATGAGVLASGGVLTVTDTMVTGNGGDGISLAGTTEAHVAGATLADNLAFGLTCDGDPGDLATSSVSLMSCTATVSGNASGDFSLFNGCEVAWSCTAE